MHKGAKVKHFVLKCFFSICNDSGTVAKKSLFFRQSVGKIHQNDGKTVHSSKELQDFLSKGAGCIKCKKIN